MQSGHWVVFSWAGWREGEGRKEGREGRRAGGREGGREEGGGEMDVSARLVVRSSLPPALLQTCLHPFLPSLLPLFPPHLCSVRMAMVVNTTNTPATTATPFSYKGGREGGGEGRKDGVGDDF